MDVYFFTIHVAIEYICNYFQERVSDPSAKSTPFAARSNVTPYAPPMLPTNIDDGMSCKGDILIASKCTYIFIFQYIQELIEVKLEIDCLFLKETRNYFET